MFREIILIGSPLCHSAGIMAILFCGIVMAHYTHFNLSPMTQITVQQIFRTMAFMAGTCTCLSDSSRKWNHIGTVCFLKDVQYLPSLKLYFTVNDYNRRCSTSDRKMDVNYSNSILYYSAVY